MSIWFLSQLEEPRWVEEISSSPVTLMVKRRGHFRFLCSWASLLHCSSLCLSLSPAFVFLCFLLVCRAIAELWHLLSLRWPLRCCALHDSAFSPFLVSTGLPLWGISSLFRVSVNIYMLNPNQYLYYRALLQVPVSHILLHTRYIQQYLKPNKSQNILTVFFFN